MGVGGVMSSSDKIKISAAAASLSAAMAAPAGAALSLVSLLLFFYQMSEGESSQRAAAGILSVQHPGNCIQAGHRPSRKLEESVCFGTASTFSVKMGKL